VKLLTFALVGPLMSWGEMSRWDSRDTAAMPTKSAVVGLLGCCLGWPRGDDRLRELDGRIRLAVRADRGGRVMTDFQTVQGSGGAPILNAEGKPRGSTIISQRQYLQDAGFQVFLYGDEAALKDCEEALRHPRWIACLGRRSCPPTRPLTPRMIDFPSVEAALEGYFDERLIARRDAEMLCQVEFMEGDAAGHSDRVLVRQDAVIRADLNFYGSRRVRSMAVKGG